MKQVYGKEETEGIYEGFQFNMKAFLILKTDNSAWVLTFDPESKKRVIYELNSWLLEKDPTPAISPAESWLEHEGAVIEAVYPVDMDKKRILIDETDLLEYTELLEDIALY